MPHSVAGADEKAGNLLNGLRWSQRREQGLDHADHTAVQRLWFYTEGHRKPFF